MLVLLTMDRSGSTLQTLYFIRRFLFLNLWGFIDPHRWYKLSILCHAIRFQEQVSGCDGMGAIPAELDLNHGLL
jgi:hypothetical protein